MFDIAKVLIAAYICLRFIAPSPWSRQIKWLLMAVVVVVSQNQLITRLFFGTRASPEIPFETLAGLGWLFGAMILLALGTLLKDLLQLVVHLITLRKHTVTLPPAGYYTMGIAVLVLSAIGVWQAVAVPQVRSIEIHLAQLPKQLDGFRLVQLTDLHASRLLERPWIQAVVDKTNALNPDLTVITGDLVDGTVTARAADVRPLRDLHAKHGVYAIPGNHEYYADYVQWTAAFKDLGLKMLLNQNVRISQGSQSLVLAGVTDKTAADFTQLEPDINAALAGSTDADTVILLSHRPKDAPQNAQAGADLQLSGHTHGGHILGMDQIVKLANGGFVSGLYQVGSMQLYVSNGAGLWNGFPLRLGRPSEITEIILRSGAG